VPKIRVLVVEDSVTVRNRLIEVLNADPDIEIVGEAVDGKTAIDRCLELRPDVITLDMMLPVMTGLAVTEYIMAHCPTPILIVSSSTNRGELFRTYEALSAGAVHVLEKPRGDEAQGVWEAQFLSALKLVSRIRVITHLRARLRATRDAHDAALAATTPALGVKRPFALVAIGASTGGPSALIELLSALPADFPLPILLVLHLGGPFGGAFADWLDGRINRRVAFAVEGQPLHSVRGRVVMAPPDQHLTIRDGCLHLTRDPERHSCRPSVDVLFESVARNFGSSAISCLLTGMGRDGATGMLAIRKSGGLTIAQNEATCIVYGMPREAVLLDAVDRILPISLIAPALAALAAPPTAERRR
jgi:two-component system chemotaxis response regulator CheB